MGRSRAPADAPDKEAVRSRRGAPEEEQRMVEDRRRCGWGAVLAVTLFATLVLTVPAGPGLG
jgi:hypothetical protein